MSCCCYFVLTLFSIDGLVIPRKFLVRSETYVFSENLVQKDYKKICSHIFTVLLLWKRFVSCDVIIVTVMKISLALESDVSLLNYHLKDNSILI